MGKRVYGFVLLNKQHIWSKELWKVKKIVALVESQTNDLVVYSWQFYLLAKGGGSRQPCSEQPSEVPMPRGNRVLYVMNINNQPPANRVNPVVWNQVHIGIMPPGNDSWQVFTAGWEGNSRLWEGSGLSPTTFVFRTAGSEPVKRRWHHSIVAITIAIWLRFGFDSTAT